MTFVKGYKMSQETKDKIRAYRLGKPVSAYQLERMRATRVNGMEGKKHTEATKQKMRETAIKNGNKPISKKGAEAWNWKGGVTPLNKKIRQSVEFKNWRKAVFKRDGYKCVICGHESRGTRPPDIHADHIKPFALFIELRFELSNGRTLCVPCHLKTDTYGGNTR